MKMVRKQVYITKEQDEELKRLAAEEGVTEAELIRRGVDLVTENADELDRQEAWKQVLEMIEERAKRFPKGGSTVKFDREEVYEERIKHLSG
jgi:hypothetical protein